MKKSITFFSLVCFTFFFFQNITAQTWEEKAIGILPNNYGVFDVAVVNEDIIWAVAFDQTLGNSIPLDHVIKVLKTIDGGATWESFDVEAAEGRISFDIAAFDANTAFITTQDYGNGSGWGVFKTEDGGATWEEKFNHAAGGVWIKFFNNEEGIVINRQSMAATQDGGETWQLVSASNIPNFLNNEFTALSSGNNSCQVVGDHVWFGTSRGRIFRSNDKGLTWEAFNTSLGNNAVIVSVAFRDSLNGVALDITTFNTSFSQTTDGGASWNNITSNPGLAIANIAYVPGTDSVLIGTSDIFTADNSRVSAYSADFGKNWDLINNDIAFSGTEFIDPNIGWTSKSIVNSANEPALYKWDSGIPVSAEAIEWEERYQVFPNPFSENIFISNSTGLQGYQLTTSNGQVILAEDFDASFDHSLNFKNLSLGMYILEIITTDGNRISKKIFKVN